LLHGEAVSLGIVMALNLSKLMGFCEGQEVDRVSRHFKSLGLPVNLNSFDMFSNWRVDNLITHMMQDKKVLKGNMRFILMQGIGKSFITSEVDVAQVREVISQSFAGEF